jgi:hypothetical protein
MNLVHTFAVFNVCYRKFGYEMTSKGERCGSVFESGKSELSDSG